MFEDNCQTINGLKENDFGYVTSEQTSGGFGGCFENSDGGGSRSKGFKCGEGEEGDIEDLSKSASAIKKPSRGITWAPSEIAILVTKWADSKIQQMVTSKLHKNREIFTPIAWALPGRDWDMCYKKMMQLIRKYREYKDSTKATGGGQAEIPSSLIGVLPTLDSVLCDKDLTNPTVISSMDPSEESSSAMSDCSSSTATSLQTNERRLRKRRSSMTELREMLEETQQRADERIEKLIKYQREDREIQRQTMLQEREKERQHEMNLLQIMLQCRPSDDYVVLRNVEEEGDTSGTKNT